MPLKIRKTIHRPNAIGSVLGADGLFLAIDPIWSNYTQAFDSGTITASDWTRVDNSISYVSPLLQCFTDYITYSLKKDTSNKNGKENNAESDRYGSLALRYKAPLLEANLFVNLTMYGFIASPAHRINRQWLLPS